MLAHYPAATAGERTIRLAITALQGMRQLTPVLRLQLQGGALPARAARACALLTTVALLPGCILKQDLPDPAFDIPAAYQKDTTPLKQDAPRRSTGGVVSARRN
jgi:hypothetical protein